LCYNHSMPELPEVETIRRGLEKYLVGHTITNMLVNLSKQISGETQAILGAKILAVKRFGKGLVIDLENGYSITIHVKMTGQLLYKNKSSDKNVIPGAAKVAISSLPDKYTHVIFELDGGAVLFYRDVRQFGWIKVVRSDSVASQPFFKMLGPEPLRDLTIATFSTMLKKVRTPIKQVLLNQEKIAGIGNIYANDALYVAGIHPMRPANSLTAAEQEKLFVAIEQVLQKGIDVGGASEWSYVDALGQAGKYQDFFQIYHKTGLPCKRCGTTIASMKMGGRGTFFCPSCQK
jgi:formamidopyrimidine-DNA glycosylase